ncbi:biotin--[acetyl-CoA-carboxylase] ligase [Methylolobus aquaticus]
MRHDAAPALTALQRALIGLLADGRAHSGSRLAAALGLSRSAIWKAIHQLEALGLTVHAVPGAGYRLDAPLELLDAEVIRRALTPDARPLAGEIRVHECIESTNAALLAAAREGAPRGTVCLAEMQTKGRGRLGRIWRSPFAGNIYLSVLWSFSDSSVLGGLSLAVGAVLIRALRAAGVAEAGLKWPNDILWNERKLGGVLVEVTGETHGRVAVVIGIGLNCHLTAREAEAIDQAVVDLRGILGERVPSRNQLVAAVLGELLPMLAAFEESGFGAHVEEWRRYHVFNGRRARLELDTTAIEGCIAGVSASGTLLLDCDDGVRREFASGDVRLRPVSA